VVATVVECDVVAGGKNREVRRISASFVATEVVKVEPGGDGLLVGDDPHQVMPAPCVVVKSDYGVSPAQGTVELEAYPGVDDEGDDRRVVPSLAVEVGFDGDLGRGLLVYHGLLQ
jgi:hypothetical protein